MRPLPRLKPTLVVSLRFHSRELYHTAYKTCLCESGLGRSSLLVGQTCILCLSEVLPSIVNLNTGCPFQPFSRSPQLQYNYKFSRFNLKAATVFQNQYRSSQPWDLRCWNTPEMLCCRNVCRNRLSIGRGRIVGVGCRCATLTRVPNLPKGWEYKVSERNVSASLLALRAIAANGGSWMQRLSTDRTTCILCRWEDTGLLPSIQWPDAWLWILIIVPAGWMWYMVEVAGGLVRWVYFKTWAPISHWFQVRWPMVWVWILTNYIM